MKEENTTEKDKKQNGNEGKEWKREKRARDDLSSLEPLRIGCGAKKCKTSCHTRVTY